MSQGLFDANGDFDHLKDAAPAPAEPGLEISYREAAADVAKKGCLVWLSVSRPSLSATLSADVLGLPPTLEGVATSPSVRPPGNYQAFSAIESRARNAVTKLALSRGDGKFVPYKLLPGLVTEIEGHKKAYFEARDRYLETFESERGRCLDKWDEEAEKLWAKYGEEAGEKDTFIAKVVNVVRKSWTTPSPSRFGMSLRVLQFSLPGISQDSGVDAGLVADEARRLARDSLVGFYAELNGELRARTVDVCTKVLAAIQSGSTFRETSLTGLRTFLTQFESLNVCGDEEVANRVNNLRDLMVGRGASDVRGNKAFSDQLSGALQAMVIRGESLLETAEKDSADMLNKRYGVGVRKVK